MGYRPYSERFILLTGSNGAVQTYTVPAGKRAILRSLLTRGISAGDGVNLTVNGVLIYIWRAPGANASANTDMRVVIYAGGTATLGLAGSAAAGCLSGYLFDDPSLRKDVPLQAGTKPVPLHEPPTLVA
jgi:hypothetical protein